MRHCHLCFLLLCTALLLPAAASASTVFGWRGDGTGRFPNDQPPLEWSKEKAVVWKSDLPSWSNASPVPCGDRLFACMEPSTLLCLSAADGTILWQAAHEYNDVLPAEEATRYEEGARKLAGLDAQLNPLESQQRKLGRKLKETPDDAEAQAEVKALKPRIEALRQQRKPLEPFGKPPTHSTNGYSSPTPVTDGHHVFALFGNGVAACYDMNGTRRWAVMAGRAVLGWGHSGSPILAEGKFVMHIGRTVKALDAATGATLWTADSGSTWGTPALARVGAEHVIFTVGGDIVRLSDGNVIAKGVASMPWTSPIVHDGIVYVIDEKGARALKLPSELSDPLQLDVLWEMNPPKDRYYASPVYADGLIYAVTQKGVLSAIDAATGQMVYEQKLDLDGTFYPSICFAGGKLFVSGDKGKTAVLEPGREYREVRVNELEAFRTSPAFVGERIYIRTLKALYCLGK